MRTHAHKKCSRYGGEWQQEKSRDKKEKGEEENKDKKTRKDNEKQKKDEAWKKMLPSPVDPQVKVNKITYHWCIHHMAWTAQKPEKCRIGKD